MNSTTDANDALVDRYLREQRWDEALAVLQSCAQEQPDDLNSNARFAHLLDALGQTRLAVDVYERLLERRPDCAAAHFNIAGLYRKLLQHDEALAAYDEAIRLDVDRVEEAYLNKGVLYSDIYRAEDAKSMYERALTAKPGYVPALFNLAGLFEEEGNREEAQRLYDKILDIEPEYWSALVRLAHLNSDGDENEAFEGRLKRALGSAGVDDQEALNFALGKVLDDARRYDVAAVAYRRANEIARDRAVPYNRAQTEQGFDQLIALYDREWIERSTSTSEAEPIFISGMYRCGSTLLETLLSRHADIDAGGELDLLPWLISRNFSPFPQALHDVSSDRLTALADFYEAKVRAYFPHSRLVTDKRPENYMHLGLVKAMFPKAKIVHVVRRIADNCLSIYFQQFDRSLGYATDLGDTAHYYRQQERLKAHWDACFGDDLQTVHYEQLVQSPETVLRELLASLNIAWDDRVLTSEADVSRVRTASIWQVRKELHTESVQRSANYESLLAAVPELSATDH